MKKPSIILLSLTLLGSALAWVWLVDPAETISLEQARIRLLPGNGPQAGYFILQNNTGQAVQLLSAESQAFAHVMMHQTRVENGQARMQSMDEGIMVKSGDSVEFAPNAMHLMLMQRQVPLEIGDLVPVSLRFRNNQNEIQEIIHDFIVVPLTP